jgi:hypothetical protein
MTLALLKSAEGCPGAWSSYFYLSGRQLKPAVEKGPQMKYTQGHRCPPYVNYLNEPTEFAPCKLFYAYPD